MASLGSDPRDGSPGTESPLTGSHSAFESDRDASGAAMHNETSAERAGRSKREGREAVEEARSGLKAAGDSVRRKAEEYQKEAKSTIGRLAGDPQATARAAVERRKDATAHDVGDVAQALRTSADDLEQRDRGAAAGYVRQAADGLERIAGNLQRQDFEGLVRQTEEFARRQPGLFVGGAVAAGFALARFLKSSAERRRDEFGRYGQGAARGGYDPTMAGGGRSTGRSAPERDLTPAQEGDVHVTG